MEVRSELREATKNRTDESRRERETRSTSPSSYSISSTNEIREPSTESCMQHRTKPPQPQQHTPNQLPAPTEGFLDRMCAASSRSPHGTPASTVARWASPHHPPCCLEIRSSLWLRLCRHLRLRFGQIGRSGPFVLASGEPVLDSLLLNEDRVRLRQDRRHASRNCVRHRRGRRHDGSKRA